MTEVFKYFLKLGATGFGGPLALVAQMQIDLVKTKKWISDKEFLNTVALIKAMPGPLAFQTGVFLGLRKAGFAGALLAAVGLVLPSFLIMLVLAYFHESLVASPYIKTFIQGMQIATVAVILVSINSLALPMIKDSLFWLSALMAITLRIFGGVSEIWIVLCAAVLGFMFYLIPKSRNSLQSVGIVELTLICLKAGAFVFGTGLAIVPFLQTDLVTGTFALSRNDFLDAVTFGQLTPGPVVITVTFIGYKIAGFAGALAATIAIFLPSFINMTTWFPKAQKYLTGKSWMELISKSVLGSIVGVLLLIVVSMTVEYNYAKMALVFVMMMLILYKNIPSWLMILAGGLISLVISVLN
jgi:chromate transporter